VVKTKGKRACPVCGTLFPDNSDSCPVCALRGALDNEPTTAESSVEPALLASQLRFEHYEILTREVGSPLELGRGAMGVTYKAVDVNLRCTVALKVIRAQFFGDESARRRFVREARAAASVRHPNVASVFHLGKSGDSYFYAMEFVEGETLQSLIKRTGRLDVKLALEIATQVASGLAAIHEQNLVHRDIKPSNIMVKWKGDSSMAKIIDLGLAKAVAEFQSETAVSIPGSFAGTPDFASPEQFAGVGVDIRSDLYSLGVTLWNMLAGQPPFRGTAAELMHQHLNAALPVERLKHLPLQVAALVEVLLKKNPAERFQNPDAFLNAVHTIEPRRPVKHEKSRVAVHDKLGHRAKQPPTIRTLKRSVAVLPFDTLGRDRRNTYCADGVQDEILSNLARVSQLKVISRTSVMTYRGGDNRNLRSIAESLGVANVVEGTVRRDGNRVRITIRLVDARTDKALWAEGYDRDLTDIFGIQSEVAQIVASRLSARLSPEEKKRIEAKPTENLEAYDLYLRAKALLASARVSWTEILLREAINFLEQALRLDPKFTLAYCVSVEAQDLLYLTYDYTPERRASAEAAMSSALRLQPDLPEVHLAYARHLYNAYRDYERARVQLAIAKRSLVNNPEVVLLEAFMHRRQGKLERAIQSLNELIGAEPGNSVAMSALADALTGVRQYRAAEKVYDRLITLLPDRPILAIEKAFVTFLKTGDNTAMRSAIAALPRPVRDGTDVLSYRLRLTLEDRDWQQARELIKKMKSREEIGVLNASFAYGFRSIPVGCYLVLLARLQGQEIQGNLRSIEAREQLNCKVQKSSGDADLLSKLAVVDALLGEKLDAITEAKRASEMLPSSRDAVHGPQIVKNLVVVYAWTGELDLSFEALAPLTKMPFGIDYGDLKLSPFWDPLRKDPRFDKLLAESAPRDLSG
jgi:serine/threonine protein kinase/tetratricopeptide (TPR) repeat protein